MILDVLENANRYLAFKNGFPKAFEFLSRRDLAELPAGKYEIDGSRVYAIIAKESGRGKEDARLEAHQQYIDIQLILAGKDEMGWKSVTACKQPAGEYDEESDIRFFGDEPDIWFPVESNVFVIFFPEDAHMPMISAGLIHKVVVKVTVEPAKEVG